MRLVDSVTDESVTLTVPRPIHLATPSGPTDSTSPLAKGVCPVRKSPRRRIILAFVTVLTLVAGGSYHFAPTVEKALQTVSTDDAYVNGHVTFVAARVPGQVARVLVDDNMRVSKGDLLVELDREPYHVQVDIKKAAVVNAEADLKAAKAQVRATLGMVGSLSRKLQAAMEQVDYSVACLAARVAALRSKAAIFDRARADYSRAQSLVERGAIAAEEFDRQRESVRVAEAGMNQARDEVFETRVYLGLPARPEKGELSDVPADLNQTFSGVRQALAELGQSIAQVGLPLVPTTATPRQVLAEIISRDKKGNVDETRERIVSQAPAVQQAATKRLQAERNLAEAELNLSYCDIRAEIDGVVMRRNVNPGNNVVACQSMMAIRSLTEIWIDANFKETQLAELKIGQRAEVDVDMYGDRKVFRGRVTGFTMGTGQTLSILPAQNATGNFVKVVQRVPVRIELDNYDPEQETLFAGLSVTPYVYVNEAPRGPWGGKRLQGHRQSLSPLQIAGRSR
jgi:membrane fusion protein (multidrug efflux system)